MVLCNNVSHVEGKVFESVFQELFDWFFVKAFSEGYSFSNADD
jgi:hypothetical protein